MVRYASLTSRMVICDSGGSHAMRRQMMENVPHVLGKMSESMWLLINEMPFRGMCGCDRFCMIQNFPGLPGLGMMLSGDV